MMETWSDETFVLDDKWILNREEEGDNSPMSQFAELNAAVLGIIHNEKRFPTKEEIAQLKFVLEPLIEDLLDIKLSETDWNDQYMTTWEGISPTFTFTDDSDVGMFSSSTDTVFVVNGETTSSDNVKVHLNGLSAVDFESLPPSALISTKGCNKHNTSEKFLNEIKNYE